MPLTDYNNQLLVTLQAEAFELIHGTIVDIEVNLLSYTIKPTTVGVLPETPLAFIRQFLYIVMGYLVRITIKL